ncbi:hypothetical protein F9C07_2208208 [Aspergillus flavus]|uniref:Uncharacterized protein n=2 Tax=Aspergillus flavus TaxID=5059 RepID=A0A7U2MGQ9_ASPFN|nr:hypothetical protein BDV35DRAFT_359604 [Aspergillus flavus]KAF7618491.1 hypothetical protein AFLA_000145 [Aspergillus flavus NRRL3357]QRD83391.1 hypothetical protein F9C07_2208208 [Aspergillus flavus]RAQ54150.1 hypothetical protein AFGD_005638 [Aspergillus flavus]RAQ58046.1 hypothetical protein COH21_010653 [Aspergillus flavus]
MPEASTPLDCGNAFRSASSPTQQVNHAVAVTDNPVAACANGSVPGNLKAGFLDSTGRSVAGIRASAFVGKQHETRAVLGQIYTWKCGGGEGVIATDVMRKYLANGEDPANMSLRRLMDATPVCISVWSYTWKDQTPHSNKEDVAIKVHAR